MPFDLKTPSAPIPGENYTSDTKNYAWHRPPEFTDMDKAIEYSIDYLSDRDKVYGLLNTLQAGVTVVQATDMFVTSAISKGKWSVDFAILLAGPVAKMIELIAKGAKITFKMGLEDKSIPTFSYLEAKGKVDSSDVRFGIQALRDNADDIEAPANSPSPDTTDDPEQQADVKERTPGGFMGAPAPVLGQVPNDPETSVKDA